MAKRISPLMLAIAAALLIHCPASWAAEGAPIPKGLKQQAAVVSPGALKASMLAVAHAGKRMVAVGDRGVVLLSDDGGTTFRQARQVPTRAALTSVTFAPNGTTGWAVGHWGVILTTQDAGDTWTLQRDDLAVDQPLFSVAFVSPQEGFAAGLWSLLLHTQDGGKHWVPVPVDPAEGAGAGAGGAGAGGGRNLFSLFSSAKGSLLIAAEQGTVYRSTDGGKRWAAIETGNKGTFWTGVGLKSGVLLVAGLGGKVYRSADDGLSWAPVDSTVKSSLTDLTQLTDGRVMGVGLNGVMVISDDDGASFKSSVQAERTALTAVIAGDKGHPVVFSVQGPLPSPQAAR